MVFLKVFNKEDKVISYFVNVIEKLNQMKNWKTFSKMVSSEIV